MGIQQRVDMEIPEAIPFLGINPGDIDIDDLSDDFPELGYDLEELTDMAEFEGFGG